MSDALTRLLGTKDIVIADGAMGTNLFLLGLTNGAASELWNVQHPEKVRSIHQGFVDVGAEILRTNTFGATRFRFKLHGLENRVRELNIAGAAIAREVADRAGRTVIVAGSMGPSGEMLEPLGTRTVMELEEVFLEQATALKEGGIDVAWIETMFANAELDAAIRAATRAGLPYVATMTFDSAGRTMMGVKPVDAMRHALGFSPAPIAFGANCGIGPAQLLDSVLGLAEGAQGKMVIVAKANGGLPVRRADGSVCYDGTPEVMANYACLARDAGARIIGGCCGTTPAHLRAMADALATRPRGPVPTYVEIEHLVGSIKKVTAHPRA